MFDNKKVLLINTPAYNSEKTFFPIEYSYLAATFKESEFACDMFDANLDKRSLNQIVDLAQHYDFVCIMSDSYPYPYSDSYAFPYTVSLAEGIKKHKNVPIVLAGRHATLRHREIIEHHKCFDAIMRGDGEMQIVTLCRDYFCNGFFKEEIYGVTYLDFHGKPKFTENINFEKDLNLLPFPLRVNQGQYAYDDLADGTLKIFVPVLTSRGCPYTCSYCSSTIFNRKWTARTSDNVADEIFDLYKTYDLLFIKFIDDNFYIDPLRSMEIVRKVVERCGEPIEFSFCTRADQIVKNGAAYLDFFKEHGCSSIEIGIENGSDNTLRRFNKRTNVKDNLQAISMVRDAHILLSIDYILFEPETTVKDLQANLSFFKEGNLWGYYRPLTYSRVFPLEGTYYEKYMGFTDEQYFTHDDVCGIYQSMQSFRAKFQARLDRLINKSDKNYRIDRKMLLSKRNYLWLRTIPYQYLSELVKNEGELGMIAEYLSDSHLHEKICEIEEEMNT